MITGRLDRRIVIQKPTATVNSIGEPVKAWADWKTVWTQHSAVKSDERYSTDGVRENMFVRFKIRYMWDLLTTYRIKYENRYYRIRGISEIRRREGMDIDAELLEGQGNE